MDLEKAISFLVRIVLTNLAFYNVVRIVFFYEGLYSMVDILLVEMYFKLNGFNLILISHFSCLVFIILNRDERNEKSDLVEII